MGCGASSDAKVHVIEPSSVRRTLKEENPVEAKRRSSRPADSVKESRVRTEPNEKKDELVERERRSSRPVEQIQEQKVPTESKEEREKPVESKRRSSQSSELSAKPQRKVSPPPQPIIEAKALPVPDDEVHDYYRWVEVSAKNYSLESWRQTLRNLIDDVELANYALARDRSTFNGNIEALRDYLRACPCADTEIKKAWLVYVWVTNNVAYSFKDESDSSALAVFKRGYGVCAGYSAIYNDLCNSVGVICWIMSGHAMHKLEWRTTGDPAVNLGSDNGHAWNLIRISGRWQLVDSTWGAGSYNDETTNFTKNFRCFYFCVPPQVLIHSHFPQDPLFQLLDEPISMHQFQDMCPASPAFFYLGIEPRSHKKRLRAVIARTNPLVIEYNVPRHVEQIWVSVSDKAGTKLPNRAFVQRDEEAGKAACLVLFDRPGQYKLVFQISYQDQYIKTTDAIGNCITYHAPSDSTRSDLSLTTRLPEYDLVFGPNHELRCISHRSLIITSHVRELAIEFECKAPAGLADFFTFDLREVNAAGDLQVVSHDNRRVQYDRKGTKMAVVLRLEKKDTEYAFSIFTGDSSKPDSSIAYRGEFLIRSLDLAPNPALPEYELAFGQKNEIECLSHKSLIVQTEYKQLAFEFKVPKGLSHATFGVREINAAGQAVPVPYGTLVQKHIDDEKISVIAMLNKRDVDYAFMIFSKDLDGPQSQYRGEFRVRRAGDRDNTELPCYPIAFGQRNELVTSTSMSLFINAEARQVGVEFTKPIELYGHTIFGLKEMKADGGLVEIKDRVVVKYNLDGDKMAAIVTLDKVDTRYSLLIFTKDLDAASNLYHYRGEFWIQTSSLEPAHSLPDYR